MNTHVLLSKARHNRKSEMMSMLDDSSKGLDVDVEDETGNSVLMIACQNNHKKIVKELLRRSCDVNHQNHKGHTCLHYSFAYKYTQLGEYLISKGADPSVRNIFGFTCFEGLDIKRPATTMVLHDACASPSENMHDKGEMRESKRRLSDAPGSPDPRVGDELRALKRRMDALEQENTILKEGGMTAQAGPLTARRGELRDEQDLKATAWAAPARAPPAVPARPASQALRSSGSGTDNDETLGAEVAEVVHAIVNANGAAGAGGSRSSIAKEDTDTESELTESEAAESEASAPLLDTQTHPTLAPIGGCIGEGKGIVGAAREAFERAAIQGGGEGAAGRKPISIKGLASRPPPSAPKPAALDLAAADNVQEDGEGDTLTTPVDCPTAGGDADSMRRSSLFPLRTPTVEEAESTVQLGGRFEKPASSVASREGRLQGSSAGVASKDDSDRDVAASSNPINGEENMAAPQVPLDAHIHVHNTRAHALAHAHAHTHVDTHARTHARARTHTLPHILSFSRTRARTRALSLSLSHTHTHTQHTLRPKWLVREARRVQPHPRAISKATSPPPSSQQQLLPTSTPARLSISSAR